MTGRNTEQSIRNPILDYVYKSWIQACGEEWTHRQVLVANVLALMFTAAIVVYAQLTELGWSWSQIFAACLITWDLTGGLIGYSHHGIKRRRFPETSKLLPVHHNLQHIHPLIVMFFNHDGWLFAVTLYWFLTFFLYVELLEPLPPDGKRRIGPKGQIGVIVVECVVALFLIVSSFWVVGVQPGFQVYGITVFGTLQLATLILISTPVQFQRTTAIIAVVAMMFIGMYLSPPDGFQWLIPVYGLKLLAGYTAKEEVKTCRIMYES